MSYKCTLQKNNYDMCMQTIGVRVYRVFRIHIIYIHSVCVWWIYNKLHAWMYSTGHKVKYADHSSAIYSLYCIMDMLNILVHEQCMYTMFKIECTCMCVCLYIPELLMFISPQQPTQPHTQNNTNNNYIVQGKQTGHLP
jgi:hypothetical protein